MLVLASGALFQNHFQKRDAAQYPAPGRLIDIASARLHLRCLGQGTPTVVMITGSGAPSVVSYELQDRLSTQTRVCSYDRAGLGWSDPSQTEKSLGAMSEDLMDLLDIAGETGPFLLAPESFGGMIALKFIQDHPDTVAGMVFIDSSEPDLWFAKTGDTLGAWKLNALWMKFAWRTGLVRLFLRFGQPHWIDAMSDQNRAWFRVIYSRPMPGYGEVGPAFRLTEPAAYSDLRPGSLGQLPTIVLIHGKTSNMLSPQFEDGWIDAQHRLASLSKNSELIIAEDLGHAMVGEDPNFVATYILQMISDIRTAR